jgi:hypothetical protein
MKGRNYAGSVSTRHRPEEVFIEEVIRRVTGAEVKHVDDGSAPGMIDALISYSDGHTAALETTTVADPKHLQMESFEITLKVPQTPYWWDLRYPKPLRRKEIETYVPTLIGWMDQLGFHDAKQLENVLSGREEWAWYVRSGVKLRRYEGTTNGGRVEILPDGGGGVVDEYLEGLSEWVEGQQSEDWWTSNVAKLARSGYSELHLAVRLHQSGMPFPTWMGLWDPIEIRSREPNGMEPLSDFWIIPAYGHTVTRWSRSAGWTGTVYEPAP